MRILVEHWQVIVQYPQNGCKSPQITSIASHGNEICPWDAVGVYFRVAIHPGLRPVAFAHQRRLAAVQNCSAKMKAPTPRLPWNQSPFGEFSSRAKTVFLAAFSMLLGLAAQAQEMPLAEADIERELPIPSTFFVPPPPPKEVPPMTVEAVTTRERPTHQITVIRSDASTLPDIPPPPEPKPFVQGPIGEPFYLLSFGATVYDHRFSHVRWYDPRTKENFEAWCAWDWTLLSPISGIKLGERVKSFHLIASNIDTERSLHLGREWKMPEHPELEELAFSITKGDANDAEAIRILTIIRDYYVKHKERLELIRQAREEYQANAAAWHAANPPKPQSHTFWLKPHRGSRYLKDEGGGR